MKRTHVRWLMALCCVALATVRQPSALTARGESLASHRDGRGAPMARRDDREYREYLSEEQRRQRGPQRGSRVGVERGCIARRMPPDFRHGLLIRTQRVERAEARGTARGQPAREQRDSQQRQRGGRKDARIARADVEEQRLDESAAGERGSEADRDAGERNTATLSSDHARDAPRVRTERKAHADFTRALTHD